MENLRGKFEVFDGKSYKLYKGLIGKYEFKDFILYFNHIQGDPFASPSKITIEIPRERANFPSKYFNKDDFIPFSDALSRIISKTIRRIKKNNRGTGNSGLFFILSGTQKILKRKEEN